MVQDCEEGFVDNYQAWKYVDGREYVNLAVENKGLFKKYKLGPDFIIQKQGSEEEGAP